MLHLYMLIFYFVFKINADCPNGSIVSYSNSSICYTFQSNQTYFLEADQFCKTLGGHLVSIHNMFDNVLISQHALVEFTESSNSDFWIGATDLISKGKWTWLDNSPFNFSDWDNGQPQNVSGVDCGAIKMNGGSWTAEDCYKQKPYVCQVTGFTAISSTTAPPKTTTIKPKSCPFLWSYSNSTNSCYKVFYNQTWLDAENRCRIDDAHLASIHSREEDIFIAKLASPPSSSTNNWLNQTWVGFYTEDNNTHWQWTDFSPFDYIQWAAYNPDYPAIENCGAIWSTAIDDLAVSTGVNYGDYNNIPCDAIVTTFVCKKSPS